MTRVDALIRQVDIVVKGTTGSTSFRQVIEDGVKNQWIQSVIVDGITKSGKIRQQIEIEFDWAEHALKLRDSDSGEFIVDLTKDERNWFSAMIGRIVDGFNEIKDEGELEALWSVRYTPQALSKKSEVERQLGLADAPTREWEDGRKEVLLDRFAPKKLSEAIFSWKAVTK
jgi:hypothetical protein